MAGIDPNTSGMIHLDGADTSTTITGSELTPKTWTAHNSAQIDTAQSKFGGASGLFGVGDYITCADSADFDFGTGDFTIDFWIRATTWGASLRLGGIGTYNSGGICWIYNSDGLLQVYINSAAPVYSTAWSPSADTWYHVAFVRTGTTFKVFIDGTQLGTDITAGDSLSTTDGVYLNGWNIATGDGLSGWMDEVRISKGIARWTADFTPETSAYSVSSTTKHLALLGVG